MIASIHARPRVNGTNKKWYSAVSANCSRDRMTTDSSIMRHLGGGREQMVFDCGGSQVGMRMRPEADEPDQAQQDQLDHDDRCELDTETMPAAVAEPGMFGGGSLDIHRAYRAESTPLARGMPAAPGRL